jgi:hypothetical protein
MDFSLLVPLSVGIVILIIAWGGFIFADPALALDVEVGQQVQLKATNPAILILKTKEDKVLYVNKRTSV